MIKKFDKFKQEPEIGYYSNGLRYEKWELNDKLHREDEPAYQDWYENGQKSSERWYLNDKLHREDGPAFISWSINGQKRNEWWILNDKHYSKEEWVNKLKEIGSPHYKEQKMLLDVEKYNI